MEQNEKKQSFEVLKKFGARWAVLAAMNVDLMKRKLSIPHETQTELEMARIKISSGCFSTCDVQCILNKIESSFIRIGANVDENYIDIWLDLLAKSMSGEIDYQTIGEIPLLKPVEMSCIFLRCGCDA